MDPFRDCMSNKIKNVLMDRIHQGIYKPGDKLIEMQIAREFNTSQAPVREALSQLESMRIIETQPFKGSRVRAINNDDLKECLQVRGALENLAAELVEDRLIKQIDALVDSAKKSAEAAKNKDPEGYALANLQFHRMIVKASNNEMLINMWNMLAPEVRMLTATRHSLGMLEQAAQEHLEIAEAFAEGDNRYAGKLLKKHAEAILLRGFSDTNTPEGNGK